MATPAAVWEEKLLREQNQQINVAQRHLKTGKAELWNESYLAHQRKRKRHESERGAAGNHSPGGKRIKVAVGEGWHSYL